MNNRHNRIHYPTIVSCASPAAEEKSTDRDGAGTAQTTPIPVFHQSSTFVSPIFLEGRDSAAALVFPGRGRVDRILEEINHETMASSSGCPGHADLRALFDAGGHI